MSSKDSRRVLGPEKSVPYALLQHKPPRAFLREDGMRWDGRSPEDPRRLFISVGMISQAKGSSYLEVGNTKVCCGVYGPRDVPRGQDFKMSGQVSCSVKMVPFSRPERLAPQPDARQQDMSRQLKDTLESVVVLEKFPKSQIDVYVTVIEDDGGLLAACITAAGLALCHANIDVYDMVVGASVVWQGNMLYVDPSREEEHHRGAEGGSQLTIGMMPKYAGGQVGLMVQQGGETSLENMCSGVDIAVEMCQKVYALVRQTLVTHVEETLEKEVRRSS